MAATGANCWEFKKCGRETGGARADEMGVCPAARATHADGIHDGHNGGRACWAVAGTMCGGDVRGSFAQKHEACAQCDFYEAVRAEQGRSFISAGPLLVRLADGGVPAGQFPRKIAYPIAGFFLALGAPIGFLLVRALSGSLALGFDALADEVASGVALYAYLTFATSSVFLVIAFLLGRKEDLVRAAHAKLARHEKDLREAYDLVVEKDAHLLADLRLAREFQQSILTQPPEVDGARIDLLYHPLDLVGGDVYYVLRDGDVLRVFLADVRGHGVEAALPTMLVMSEYEIIRGERKGPADTLAALNARFASAYARLELHFTAICLELDLRTGRAAYATAAHPELCVVGPEGGRELETGGTFIGLVPDATFPEWSVQLDPGDRVLLYTDGVTEQGNRAGELFGSHRLMSAVGHARDTNALASDALLAHLRRHAGTEGRLDDDVTLLEICWSPESAADDDDRRHTTQAGDASLEASRVV